MASCSVPGAAQAPAQRMCGGSFLERLGVNFTAWVHLLFLGTHKDKDLIRLLRRARKDRASLLTGNETFFIYALARAHFRARHGVDANLYLIAISRQLRYLRGIIQDETTNFRAKLKRGDARRRELFSQRPGPVASPAPPDGSSASRW